MKDPVRLLEGEANSEEKLLLAAAAAEEPPVHGAQLLAASLGIASFSSIAVPPVAKAAAGKSLLAKLTSPWLLLGAGGAIVTTLTLLPTQQAPTVRPPSRTQVQVQSAPEHSHRDEAVVNNVISTVSESLQHETKLLDHARARLRDNDAATAQQLLLEYAQAHPRGLLRQEALLLELECAVGMHDTQRSERAADQLLSDYPATPHAKRVRSLLQQVRRNHAR